MFKETTLQSQNKPLGGPNSRDFFPRTRATFHPNFMTLACPDREISKPEVALQPFYAVVTVWTFSVTPSTSKHDVDKCGKQNFLSGGTYNQGRVWVCSKKTYYATHNEEV
ncbi:hypothetical protein Bbelb_112770 [Branchiostoma belcheri]|nr:hypothetical protein Bbelb_112770 [Branchiostoma belcheri]